MNVITKQNIFFSSFYLSAKIYWKSIELSPIIMRANKRQNHRVFLIIEIGLISRIDIAFFRFKMIDEFSFGNQTSDSFPNFTWFHILYCYYFGSLIISLFSKLIIESTSLYHGFFLSHTLSNTKTWSRPSKSSSAN